MFALLFLAAAQASHPKQAVVYKEDSRATATVAEGFGRDLAPIKSAAERCGFSRTWVWDDNSDGSQLWVLAQEVTRPRADCLNRWRTTHRPISVKWKLHQSASR